MKKHHCGFTLVEIIVVLAISAVMTTGTIMGFKSLMAANDLRVAGNRMMQDIRTTQQIALAENSSEHSYFIQFYQDPANNYIIKRSATPLPIIIASVSFPTSVALVTTNFDSQMLSLSSKGIPARGGTITLKNQVNGKLSFVIVASVTGRVRVSDRPPDSWEIK